MKRVYIGIDAHKESNVLALAFAGTAAPEMYGKASADLKACEAVLRRIIKKYELCGAFRANSQKVWPLLPACRERRHLIMKSYSAIHGQKFSARRADATNRSDESFFRAFCALLWPKNPRTDT